MIVEYIVNDVWVIKFDFNLEVIDFDQCFGCCLIYSCDLFDELCIVWMVGYWQNLLEVLLGDLQWCIVELLLFVVEEWK